MKPKTSLQLLLALAGSSIFAVTSANAASGTWDTDADGDWTTVTNWFGNTAYATGEGAIATLSNLITADRVINLDSGITIGGITALDFSNNYTISGGNILTLNVSTGAPVIDVVPSNRTLTISSQVAGNDGLTKLGAGTLILSSDGTNYTGTTTIQGGTLTIGTGTAGRLNGTTGTALTFTGSGTFNVKEANGSTQGMGLLTLSSGDATIQSTYATSGNTTLTFSNVATRTAGATANFVSSGGTNGTTNKIVLTQFGGSTTPTGAVLDRGIFYNGSSYAVYDSGGFVRGLVYGTDTNANASLSGTAVDTLGTIDANKHAQFVGAATTTTTASAQATGLTTLTVANGAAFRVGQAISGTGVTANTFVTAISGNVLTLSQAAGTIAANAVMTPYNSVYAQTTGSLNTLNLSGAGASLTLAADQTLSVNGILRSNGTSNVVGAISGGTGIQTVSSGGEMVIRTNVGNDTLDISSAILDNGNSSLTKTGDGTLVLSGANTYSGATTVNAGILRLSSSITNTSGFVINGGVLGSSTDAALAMTTATLADKNITVNGVGSLGVNAATTSGAITLNDGSALSLLVNGTSNFNGAVTGAGKLILNYVTSNQPNINFYSLENTFTGVIDYLHPANGNFTLNLKSFVDSSTLGAGNIRFGVNGGAGTHMFNLASGYKTGGLTLNNRQFEIAGNATAKLSNGSAEQFTINSDLLVSTTGTRTLQLAGAGAGLSTFAGDIANGNADTLNLTKSDGGTWILSGNNTYTGKTTISGGRLSINSIQNAGSTTANALGTPAAGANSIIDIANSSTLQYTGTGHSSDRVINNTTSNGGTITLEASGASGTFALTGGVTTASTSGTSTVVLTGTGLGSQSGAISNGTGTNVTAVTKSGTGTWTLSGNNGHSGSTTLNAGTLTLDYSTNNNAKFSGSLALNGGTLELSGGSAFTQSATSTTLNNGGTFIKRTNSGTNTLAMGAITFTGGAVDFAAGSIATTTTSNHSSGALASAAGTYRATVAGADWAKNDGAGNIVAFAPGDYTSFTGGATSANINYSSVGDVTLGASSGATSNTFKITTSGAGQSMKLNSNFNLSLGSLLFAGAHDYTIASTDAGTGRFGSAFNLHNYGTSGATLTLGALGGNLTQFGTGKTILSQNSAANSTVSVNGGTVQISNNLQIGTNSGVVAITLNNGTLLASETLALDADGAGLRARTITLGAGGGTLAAASTKTLTVSGVISGALNQLTLGNATSTGTVTLTATNTYTGTTLVSAGTLAVGGSGDINTSSSITVAAGGTLRYNSSTALTVAPTLNGTGTGSGQRAVLGGGDSTGTNGVINASVTLNNLGDTLSPGNSPGILPFAVGQTWASNSYDWEINDWANSVAGTDIDQIQITGMLDLSAVAADQYRLNVLSLTSGNVAGDVDVFSEINKSWTILTASGGITGFAESEWDINATGFTNSEGGTWGITYVDDTTDSLALTYTAAIPEPGSVFLGSMGLLLILRRRR